MNIMIAITDSSNTDFIELIKLLDEDLENTYGELQKSYKKYNVVQNINNVVIAYNHNTPIGCGGFKEFDNATVELKRIFVKKEYRGQGVAKTIVDELEKLAKANGYTFAVLETGVKQMEALKLYKGKGYGAIKNYGPYEGNANSICMRKVL